MVGRKGHGQVRLPSNLMSLNRVLKPQPQTITNNKIFILVTLQKVIFRNLSPTKRAVIAGLLLFPLYGIPAGLGTLLMIRSAKSLSDLDYAKGTIENIRFINTCYKPKRAKDYQHILAMRIEGVPDEFGFEVGDQYDGIVSMKKTGRTAEIYYDKDARRDDEEVISQIYDMTVGSYKVVDFEAQKKQRRITAAVLYSFSALVLSLFFLALRYDKRRKQRRVLGRG
jgi:hypothetical protein